MGGRVQGAARVGMDVVGNVWVAGARARVAGLRAPGACGLEVEGLGDGPQGAGRLGDGPQGAGRLGDGPQGGGQLGDGPQGGGRLGDGPQGSGRLGDGPQGAGRLGDGALGDWGLERSGLEGGRLGGGGLEGRGLEGGWLEGGAPPAHPTGCGEGRGIVKILLGVQGELQKSSFCIR